MALIATVTSLFFLLVSGFFFGRDVFLLHQAGVLPGRLPHPHPEATAKDVHTIESWMTFDFVNVRFNLPLNYLKDTLTITDSQYPRETIREAAERAGIETELFLSMTKDAVVDSLTRPQK